MIKKLYTYHTGLLLKAILCISVLVALGTTKAVAQFAVSEDFRGTANPDIVIGGPGGTEGTAYLTSGNGDPVNSGFLRLTNSNTYQKGYAYVDKSFPSTMGVLVDFEYKMWRDVNDGNGGADGIGVFLFDASSTFQLGGYGGSLGYAPNNPTTGLSGGYVGVGLDAYGNYSNPSEGRNGGPGETPNAVVLRGPTTTNTTTTNTYLTGISLGDRIGGNGAIRGRNEIDYNTQTTTRPTDNDFYRRVQIEIIRLNTAGTYYQIVIRWKKTPGAAFTDLISYNTTDVPPALLKLGFAASSGASRNYHEIRNLLVTTPNNLRVRKTANKDFVRTVSGGNNANQITYTIEITNDNPDPVFNIDFIDEIRDGNGNLLPTSIANSAGFLIETINQSNFTGGTVTQVFLTNRLTGTMSMAANSTATVTVTGRLVNSYLPAGNRIFNTATATPPSDDDLNNNTSTVKTPVIREGIDFVPTHTVDENCADGSNTFTVNIANNGSTNASVGTGNNDERLTLAIRVPRSTLGYVYTVNTSAGWTLIETVNNGNGSTATTTRTYMSTQNASMVSGSAYNYPFVYTVSKPTPYDPYTTRATIAYIQDEDDDDSAESTGTAISANNVVNISIVAPPAAPTANNVYYCLGETPSPLTATATGTNDLKWYFSASGGFSSDYAPTPLTDTAGIQSFWVAQINGSCESQRKQIFVHVAPTPTPGSIAADQYFCNGGGNPALLTSVTAGTTGSAAGMTFTRSYKWQRRAVIATGDSWQDIGSATNDTYDPPAITETTRYRRITVATHTTNGASDQCQSEATNEITVTVQGTISPGTIGSNQTICSNATATITGSQVNPASGATITYRWESSANSGGPFATAAGTSNGQNYTTAALTATTYFRRIVISTIGANSCESAAPAPVVITVPNLVAGTIVSDQVICAGSSPTVALTSAPGGDGSGTATTYKWQSSSNGDPNGFWNDINVNNITYLPTGAVNSTLYYRRVIMSTTNGVFCQVASNIVRIAPTNPQGPGTVVSYIPICSGSTVTISSTADATFSEPGATLTYAWQSNSGSGWSADIPGANGPSYTTPAGITQSTNFRRYPIATYGPNSCRSTNYTEAQVVVMPDATGGSIETTGGVTSLNICSGTIPPQITNVSNGTNANQGYIWQYSTASIPWTDLGGVTSSTSYTPTSAITVTTYFRRLGVSNNGIICRGTTPSNTVTFTVVTSPAGGTAGANQTICSGGTPTTLNVTGGVAGTYRWETRTNPSGTWVTVTPAAAATGASYSPGSLTTTTYYRRVTLAGACASDGYSTTVTITVSPVVNGGIASANQNICNGGTTSALSVTGASAGTYRWEISSTNLPNSWSTVGTSDTYNPGTLTGTRYYRRATISGSCEGFSSTVTITVSAPTTAGSINGAQTICMDTTPTILGTPPGGIGTGSGTITYRWERSPNGSTGWVTIPGAADPTYQPPLLHITTHYRRYTISTSTVGGITATCESGPTGTVVVTTKNCKVITNPMVRSRVN